MARPVARSSRVPLAPTRVRLLLGLSVPIAVGAIVASLAGLLFPSVYEAETRNWAAQGRGQDAVNLLVYPLLLGLAWLAWRGSLRAYLAWLGVIAYSAYSYLLYAGWVHFGGLFPLYVLTFGLSTYVLIGGLAALDPARVRAAFPAPGVPRGVGTVLVALGGLFALLWLSEIVPALLTGSVPEALVVAGLSSNPVWVLDLGIVLPGMILAGWSLRRGRPLGHLLAAPLLAFGVVMSVAIVGIFVALSAVGEPVAVVPALMISLVVLAESAALLVFSRALRPGTALADVVRTGWQPAKAEQDNPLVVQT